MLPAGIVSAGIMLGAASVASAERVEHSGLVYHIAVCSHLTAEGNGALPRAVVTDRLGQYPLQGHRSTYDAVRPRSREYLVPA